MARKKLDLGSLGDLSQGRIVKAFNAELNRASLDAVDRPDDTTERRVTLEMYVAPIKGELGEPTRAKVRFRVASRIPPRTSGEYEVAMKDTRSAAGNRSVALQFNASSEDDAEQMTIDELDSRS